jgi:hypothetical protein
MLTRSPSSAARRERRRDRQRRYRARLKACEIVLPVVVSHAIIALLLDLGWLPVPLSEDRRAIAAAIRALLEDTAKRSGS